MPLAPQPFPILPDSGRHVPSIVDDDEDENAPDLSVSPDASVEEQEDGSAIVDLGDDDDEPGDPDFGENLAEVIDPVELNRHAHQLLDHIDRDREARKARDDQYALGIRRTGIGEDAPGGADFDGASRATHPMLVEGCVDFASRAIKELFPAKGPCRTQIIGEATRGALEKAERKKTYMNWQLTTQIPEYRGALEQCLTQVPLGGSQYLKVYPDPRLKRPRVEAVFIDDVLLPFAATDFYTAQRITHVQHLTRYEFDARVASGLYRDITVGDTSDPGEKSASSTASDKAEGRDDASYNEDGLRTVYESNVLLAIEGDDFGDVNDDGEPLPVPYIMTIDEVTRQCVGLRRNWEEDDEKFERLHWLIEFGLIPWRGAYKIGLAHLIGSMAGAATGALRALLDSAHIQNFPGGLVMKGPAGSVNGQSKTANPGELTQVEAPVGVDDIRKLAMPFPFAGPSAVLFQLLEWLTQHGAEVIGTAEEKLGDSPQNAPVGTTLAMIEQGSLTYSAIHGRLHESQKRVMAIIHRLNADLIDDQETVEELGSLVVYAADFQGPMDVIPVSDPNIFSDAQRYAQLQAVMQLAQQYPQFYKLDVLNRRALQLLNYPGAEEVLATPGDPKRRTPIEENVAARQPETALKAYPDQDHLLHLQMHLQFATSPIFCANQMMAVPSLPALLQHCAEHLVEFYQAHATAAWGAAKDIASPQEGQEDSVLHDAMVAADQEMAKDLAQIMPMLQTAQQALAQFGPKPPPDPAMAAKQAELAAKQQSEAQAAQQDAASQKLAQQSEQILMQMEQNFEERMERLKQSSDSQRHDAEMAIAARNADVAAVAEHAKQAGSTYATQIAEIGANERTAMTNETSLSIAQMKGDMDRYGMNIDALTQAMTAFMSTQEPEAPATPAPDNMSAGA